VSKEGAGLGNQSKLESKYRSDPIAEGRGSWRAEKCMRFWIEYAPKEQRYIIGKIEELKKKRIACRALMIEVLKMAGKEKKAARTLEKDEFDGHK
jgi:hypothetical protein